VASSKMRSILFLALISAAAVSASVWGITKVNQVAFLNTDGDDAGLWTLVGEAYADHHMITLIQIGDIDSSAEVFYIIAINRTMNDVNLELVGLSLTTGQIVSETVLPFVFSFNYVNTPGVDVIAGTSDVLVYGLNHKSNNFEIYRLTPGAGAKLMLVASWPDNGAFIQSVDSFDYTNNLLWVQLEMNNNLTNLAFDITNGNMMYNLTDPYGMQSLNYDPINQQIIGLGSPMGDGTTPLVAISGGQYSVLASLQAAYTNAGPDDAAFDIQGRMLYQYVDNGSTMQLIVVNVDTGATSFLPYTEGVSTTPATICFSS